MRERGLSVQSEHLEQCAVIKWFDIQYPALRGRLFAVPNGGHRHPAVAVKLKAEGVRKGVPDLWLPVPRHGFSGLVVELKAGRGRLTPEQDDWLNFLAGQGFATMLCHGADAAIRTIREYLE